MTKQKSGTFDQRKYVREYLQENIIYRKINFNAKKPEDMVIKEWLDAQKEEGISNYLKRLIRADMEAHGVKTEATETPG